MTSKETDSNLSRFELDGVVAEMDIEIEEDEPSLVDRPYKISSKADTEESSEEKEVSEKASAEEEEKEDDEDVESEEDEEKDKSVDSEEKGIESSNDAPDKTKILESSPRIKEKDALLSEDNEEKESGSANDDQDQAKRLRGRPKKKEKEEAVESTDNEEKESESSNVDSDQAKRSRGRPRKAVESSENEEKGSESSNPDQVKKLRGRPKKLVESEDNEGKESSSADPDQIKRSRGRPRKSESNQDESDEKSEVDSDARPLRTRTSAVKSEVTSSLKRKAMSGSSQEEEDEVPEKKLRSSSKDSTQRAKTTLKDTQTSAKSTGASGKSTASASKSSPVKYKEWNLDPFRINNLESFPVIKRRVQRAELKYIKGLHQVLFNNVFAKDGKGLRKDILEFQGFSFKKNSMEYKKRKTLLEKMPESIIYHIGLILDRTEKNASSIMEFLEKPANIIYCEVDPLDPSMQPSLKLQKVPLDDIPIEESSDFEYESESLSSEDTLVTSKRKRFLSSKLRFYESEFELPASKKKSQETERFSSSVKVKKEPISRPSSSKKVSSEVKNQKKTIVQRGKLTTSMEAKKVKTPEVSSDRKMKIVKRPVSSDLNLRRKALDLAIEIQETVGSAADGDESQVENEESALESFEYDYDVKQELVTDDEAEDQGHKSKNSSEGTLSADEDRETSRDNVRKKRFYKTPAIPLKTFPAIRDNILKADFSALQRLHIVLFGSSDKASNLKGNILSFGGFPFYKGSEEWKQKQFLMSLLSQTTLKEYLDVLDIKYNKDANQRILIRKLMNFLVAPIEKSRDDVDEDDNEGSDTEVVSIDQLVPLDSPPPASPPPVSKKNTVTLLRNKKFEAQKKKVELPKKKPAKKPEEPKKNPRVRKVLMDEAQVRRLEADLAREQRILEREKKLHEEQMKKLDPSNKFKVLNQKPKVVAKPLPENHTDTELLNALMETVYQRRELKKAGAKVSVPNKGGHTRLGELANVKFLVVTANYNDLDVLHHLIYMTEATKQRVRKNILDFAGFNFTEESPAYQDRMNFLKSLGYGISRRIAFLLGLCPFKTLIDQQDLNELIMYFLMSPCQSKQVPIRDLPNTFFTNEMPVELSALVEKHSEDITVIPETQPTFSASQGSTPAPRAKKSFKSSFASPKLKNLKPSPSTLPLKTPDKLIQPNTKQTPTTQQAHPDEMIVRQQQPDGQQKTFKLVKLPADHPLLSSLKIPTPLAASTPTKLPASHPLLSSLKSQIPPQAVISTQAQPITINPPVIGAPGLPPGLIVFKNNPTNPALSTVMQTVPLTLGQSASTSMPALVLPSSPVVVSTPGEGSAKERDSNVSADSDELNPEDEPPTDEDIYGTIQDIIHEAPSLEDITLRNVIHRVSAKYPNFDLTPQHYFMKECVKKIIMGT